MGSSRPVASGRPACGLQLAPAVRRQQAAGSLPRAQGGRHCTRVLIAGMLLGGTTAQAAMPALMGTRPRRAHCQARDGILAGVRGRHQCQGGSSCSGQARHRLTGVARPGGDAVRARCCPARLRALSVFKPAPLPCQRGPLPLRARAPSPRSAWPCSAPAPQQSLGAPH